MDIDMINQDYIPSPEDIEEERKNFLNIIAAFKHYATYSVRRVNKTEAYLNTLPTSHQLPLSRYRDHLNSIRNCIDANHRIIRKMISDVDTLFTKDDNDGLETRFSKEDDGSITRIRQQDFESVQITLKQFARDWSSDGEEERRQCYKPIIDEIISFYNPNEIDIGKVKVLVPGAGLGRLTYELSFRGYYCEGNEVSLFMLIASNFVLNNCTTENQYTLYPWVHQYVNNVARSDQVAPITFPDVSPTETPPKGKFTMVAGDFLQVYVMPNYWDCVATCFFIDCANNVVEFVEAIYRILKPGAIWVNLGPLLYHYSDIQDEFSIEPTFEDLIAIIKSVGFEILKEQTNVRTKYAQNPRSMQQSEYLSVFFVCRKPLYDVESSKQMNGIHNGDNN